jgi:hypothetical protein
LLTKFIDGKSPLTDMHTPESQSENFPEVALAATPPTDKSELASAIAASATLAFAGLSERKNNASIPAIAKREAAIAIPCSFASTI